MKVMGSGKAAEKEREGGAMFSDNRQSCSGGGVLGCVSRFFLSFFSPRDCFL